MGMIFGGTGVQTLILLIITIRCDWEEEVWIQYTMLQVFLGIRFTFEHMFYGWIGNVQAKKASLRVERWTDKKFESKE